MISEGSSKQIPARLQQFLIRELPRHSLVTVLAGAAIAYAYRDTFSLFWLSLWFAAVAGLSLRLFIRQRNFRQDTVSSASADTGEDPGPEIRLCFFLQGALLTFLPVMADPVTVKTLLILNALVMLSGVLLFTRFTLFAFFASPVALAFIAGLTENGEVITSAGLAAIYLVTILATFRASQVASRINRDSHRLFELNNTLERIVDERTRDLTHSELQLKMAIEASDIGIWDWNLKTKETYFADCLNLIREKETKSIDDFRQWIHPDDYSKARRRLVQHLKGRTQNYRVRYRVRDLETREWRWIEDTGKAIARDENGKVTRMIGTRREVTREVVHEQDLNLAASLFTHSEDAVFVMSSDFIIQAANPAFCRIMDATRSELIERSFSSVSASSQIHQVLTNLTHKGHWQGELLEKRYNGETFPFKCRIDGIFDQKGRLNHYIAIGSDMTQMRQNQVEIDYLSNYDKLTGLANRSHFYQVLNRHLKDPQAASDSMAIIIINLDRFQSINDSLGYEVGDMLLKDIANRLNNLNSPATFCARLGGDEFVIMAEFFGSREKLNRLLDLALMEISRPVLAEEHELIVTASLGVAILNGQNRHQLLNQATLALNKARQKGGNNYRFYDKAFRSSGYDRLEIEKALRRAIAQNELSVAYQPKLNLNTGHIDSVEALVRWHHPTIGLIEPEQFIPIAEEIGLINSMGEQVLYKACDEVSTWQQRGFGNIRVSVNLSSHQLRQDNLYDAIFNVLKTSELPPDFLELELTESVLIENMDHSLNTLNRIHALGTKIALDDFGTGYSSLSYLQKLPLDVLKIDKSFLQNLEADKEDNAVIKAIIALANSMSMEVVAEGVENREQLEFLKSQGCHYAQGYLVSQPLPASEVLNILRHYNFRNQPETYRVH